MKRAVPVVVAAVLGVLVFAGCSDRNPNVAAQVNGSTISATEVEQVSAALAEAQDTPTTPGSLYQTIASQLVLDTLIIQAGEAQGVAITDADVASALATSTELTAYAKDPRLTNFTNDYVRRYLIQQKLGTDAAQQAVTDAEVVVNPRFGVWDSTTGVTGSGSLSEVAPARAGS